MQKVSAFYNQPRIPNVTLWTERAFAGSVEDNGEIKDIPGAQVHVPEGRAFNVQIPFLFALRTRTFTLPNPKTECYGIPTLMRLTVQTRMFLGQFRSVRYDLTYSEIKDLPSDLKAPRETEEWAETLVLLPGGVPVAARSTVDGDNYTEYVPGKSQEYEAQTIGMHVGKVLNGESPTNMALVVEYGVYEDSRKNS